MDNQERRKLFEESLVRLRRLQEEARAGHFSVGAEPKTRTQANIDAQVGRFQNAIDDIELALKKLDGGDG